MVYAKMQTLDDLAVKYGTDKQFGVHGYTQTYARHLNEIRKTATAVFEIGVDKGSSIKMWRDYFANAKITGMDIKQFKPQEPMGERVEVFCGDQTKTKDLLAIADKNGPFDLIVDDGSHDNHAQLHSFGVLWPYVKPGGFYIVEDICCSYWQEYGNTYPPHENSGITGILRLVHDVNFRGFKVGKQKHRSANYLLKQVQHMPHGMHTDIEEMIFANSTVLLRKRKTGT